MSFESKKDKDKIKETVLTYEDYSQIDDGNRYELANGELVLMSPAPSVTHQIISFQMQKRISQSCDSDYLILNSPIDVILSITEVRQPDLIIISKKRLNIVRKHGIEGPPDLVVEISSPSSRKRDKVDKLKSYAYYGILEFWIVEPELGTLEQYLLHETHYDLTEIFQNNEIITSPNIPCISFTMAEIMEKVPELRD